jgi:hypothetical protein
VAAEQAAQVLVTFFRQKAAERVLDTIEAIFVGVTATVQMRKGSVSCRSYGLAKGVAGVKLPPLAPIDMWCGGLTFPVDGCSKIRGTLVTEAPTTVAIKMSSIP